MVIQETVMRTLLDIQCIRFYYTKTTSYTFYRQKIYIGQIQYAIDTMMKYYYP